MAVGGRPTTMDAGEHTGGRFSIVISLPRDKVWCDGRFEVLAAVRLAAADSAPGIVITGTPDRRLAVGDVLRTVLAS